MEDGEKKNDGDAKQSFGDIARSWSKIAQEPPELLLSALVSAFWSGDFEENGHSAVVVFVPPVSPKPGRPIKPPGSYALRGTNVVLKVGKDGGRSPTAERREVRILREQVAFAFHPEGITQEFPAGFGFLSDKNRDKARPNWRKELTERYRGLSTLLFQDWSCDMRDDYRRWCIRRHDFVRWYRTSPLLAGAPIEGFWPGQVIDHTEREIGPASSDTQVASSPRPKKSRSLYGPDIIRAAKVKYADGIPTEYESARLKRDLMPLLEELKIKMPKDGPHAKTFGRILKDYPRRSNDQ
jgi:hypothetical protein